MSKRTGGLERRKNDAYDTPLKPVLPLLPQLLPGTRFIEPCAGKGDLAAHLQANGHYCIEAYDIAPRADWIHVGDATGDDFQGLHPAISQGASCYITNPPWTRELLHAIIDNLAGQLPTWLLFDADWASNVHSASRLDFCERIVPVGRVKWIENTKHQGVDNAAWYRFDKTHSGGPRWINWRNR